MRKANVEDLIALSNELTDDPIAKAVVASTEVGVVVPSILTAKLEAAGYPPVKDGDPKDHKPLKHLKRVLLKDGNGAVIAQALAGDYSEALLHAVMSYLREQSLAKKAA